MSKEIETKAVELLDKLENLATQYTPEVVDAATQAVQITAIGNIISGFVSAIIMVLVFKLSKKTISYCIKKKEEGGRYSDWEVGIVISSVVGVVLCVFLAGAAFVSLTDVWNWVALINPELALAHKVLGL